MFPQKSPLSVRIIPLFSRSSESFKAKAARQLKFSGLKLDPSLEGELPARSTNTFQYLSGSQIQCLFQTFRSNEEFLINRNILFLDLSLISADPRYGSIRVGEPVAKLGPVFF